MLISANANARIITLLIESRPTSSGVAAEALSFAAGSLGFLTPFSLDGWVRTLTHILDLHDVKAPPLPTAAPDLRLPPRGRLSDKAAGGNRRGGVNIVKPADIERNEKRDACSQEVS